MSYLEDHMSESLVLLREWIEMSGEIDGAHKRHNSDDTWAYEFSPRLEKWIAVEYMRLESIGETN